ncbi:hypothetical protein Dalk_0166 [Desulfatibacillum aliphaticivorans]|uniref:Uncharacterized protein n=1 Tax=Desulfatibacillum aliphaticivorans TaxID=218208 RepID=B8FMK9_DESAL|nr:hypothetical protein [Desulfatibacillum aliphaticivorans]ACL01876.1 hypothetical protein Dalk_0166 [Desulfatibacillum aliphaticivorans]
MLGISVVYALDEPSTAMLAVGNQFYNGTLQMEEFVYDIDNGLVVSATAQAPVQSGYLFNPFADLAMDEDSNLHRAVIGAYFTNLTMHALGPGEYGGVNCYKGEYYENTRIFCPYVVNTDEDETNIDIMNKGNSAAQVSVIYYNEGGVAVGAWIAPAELQPGETIRPDVASELPQTTASAVISATEPLVASVEIFGDNQSMVYAGVSVMDSYLYVPKLNDGQDDGWESTTWVQNAEEEAQDVLMEFFSPSGNFVQSETVQIAPGGVFGFETPVGASCAYIRGQDDVAAVVVSAGDSSYYAYKTRGVSWLPLIPLVMKNADGWNTSITIQNPASGDCEVYWKYLDQGGNQVGNNSSSVVIAPDGAYTFSLEDDPTLSSNQSFLGAVKIFAYHAQNPANYKSAASSIYVPVVATHEKGGKKAAVSVGPYMGDKASKDFNEPLTWGYVYGFPVVYQYAYDVEENEEENPLPDLSFGDNLFCFVDSLKN